MLTRTILFLFLGGLLVCFGGCEKDLKETDLLPSDTIVAPRPKYKDRFVPASVQGRVRDEHGKPLPSATVSVRGQWGLTDEHGVFSFYNVSIAEQFGSVKVEKAGYLPGFRTIATNQGKDNFVEIQLIRKVLQGSFSSLDASVVAIEGKARVSFPAGGIVDAQGRPYSGTVNVYGAYLDPEDQLLPLLMPGDLRGLRADSSVSAMVTFGMLIVELEDAAGNRLQLAPNHKARIAAPVAVGQRAQAPARIPLWHFSETRGMWIEEGEAVRTGDEYHGEVSHFSAWNFDGAIDYVTLTLDILTSDGYPLSYTKIKISDVDPAGGFNMGFTNSEGKLKIWAPKGSPLKLEVLGDCASVSGSLTLGAFLEDAERQVKIDQLSAKIEVSGAVVDCSGRPIPRGTVRFIKEGLIHAAAPIVDGVFEFGFLSCAQLNEKWQLLANAGDSSFLSTMVTRELYYGENKLGTIDLCGPEEEEYIRYTMLGATIEMTPSRDSVETELWDMFTDIRFFRGKPREITRVENIDLTDNGFYLSVPNPTPPRYQSNEFVALHQGVRYEGQLSTFNTTLAGDQYGDFLFIHFSGEIKSPNITSPIMGEMKIRLRKLGMDVRSCRGCARDR